MKKILFIFSFFLWTCGGGGSPTESIPELPTVQNINLDVVEDTPKSFIFIGNNPEGGALTYTISSQPQNGTIQISGSAGTYTPDDNFNGQDTFYYIANSVNGSSNIGTVLVNVVAVDDQPIFISQSFTTEEDTNLKIVFEYEEFDGQDVKFSWGGGASHGTVTFDDQSCSQSEIDNRTCDTVNYGPNGNYFGTDSFGVTITDANSRRILTQSGIEITITPVNDAPTVSGAINRTMGSNETLEINLEASDIENDNLTYEIVNQPNYGTYSIDGYVLSYTSSSPQKDSFTYRVYDGTDYSDEGSININKYNIIGGSENELITGGQIIDNGTAIIGLVGKSINNVTSDYIGLLNSYNSDSSLNWSLEIDDHSGNDILRNMQNDNSGNIYVINENYAGSGGTILYSISSSGTIQSSTALQSYIDNNFTLADGNIASSSFNDNKVYLNIYDINQNLIWSKMLRDLVAESSYDTAYSFKILYTSDGGYIVSFIEFENGVSVFASVTIKVDSQGNILWTKEWDEAGDQYIHSMIESSNGDLIFAGHNNYIHYLLKTDSSGNEIWSSSYGWSTHSYGNTTYDVCETSDGGIATTGYSKLPEEDGSNERLIINKHDASGNFEWYKTIIPENSGTGRGVSINQIDGNIIISGEIELPDKKMDVITLFIDNDGNRIY